MQQGWDDIVKINVCGTTYECRKTVIESHEDTLLAMLLKHYDKDKKESLFVQRDPKMFRWILYWYTTGILVEADTVKVHKEVWDEELRYYALFPPTDMENQESKKRIRDESHELRQKAIEHFGMMGKAYQERRVTYGHLLSYMMDKKELYNTIWSHFTFIAPEGHQKQFTFPDAYDVNVRINPSWLKQNFEEFRQYSADVGFEVVESHYSDIRINHNHRYPPASCMHVTTQHCVITVAIRPKDN